MQIPNKIVLIVPGFVGTHRGTDSLFGLEGLEQRIRTELRDSQVLELMKKFWEIFERIRGERIKYSSGFLKIKTDCRICLTNALNTSPIFAG
jgi:hypothetical protein